MKEVKLKTGNLWSYIIALVITAMLCGTAVFVSMQYSQTQREVISAQKDIANTQAQAMKESASKTSEGLSDIGRGICSTNNSMCFGY